MLGNELDRARHGEMWRQFGARGATHGGKAIFENLAGRAALPDPPDPETGQVSPLNAPHPLNSSTGERHA